MYDLITYKREYDPTHTITLRRMFSNAMKRRFNELIAIISKAVVEYDVFGLNVVTQQMNAPLPGAFSFDMDVDKVEAFLQWLQQQVDAGVLEVSEIPGTLNRPYADAWTNKYITDSYKRGLIRARAEMRKVGMNVPTMDDSGGIEAVMGTPFHVDRVGLLYLRTFEDLKNVTSAMVNQIGKVLTQGMVDGDNPRLLARKLRAVIDGTKAGELGITDTLGRFIPAKRRAEMIARTETIRAHHLATINEYEAWGVTGVNVMAELKTAGDARVCDRCLALEAGGPYTLEVIRNMIPVHTNCRCISLPLIKDKQIL